MQGRGRAAGPACQRGLSSTSFVRFPSERSSSSPVLCRGCAWDLRSYPFSTASYTSWTCRWPERRGKRPWGNHGRCSDRRRRGGGARALFLLLRDQSLRGGPFFGSGKAWGHKKHGRIMAPNVKRKRKAGRSGQAPPFLNPWSVRPLMTPSGLVSVIHQSPWQEILSQSHY